MLKVTL